MKLPLTRWPIGLLIVALYLPAARAFPPAPDGLIYGVVKDQYGTPLMNTSDRVILVTPGGNRIVGTVQPGLAVGINYALDVPMDTGLTPDPYVRNALTAGAQYKLYVAVGTVTNLPIEMLGAYSLLGKPGLQTRQDLTLGTDVNGNGIPDAWESVFLAEIGANIALTNINPNADYAHDGRSLREEYLLGNYPFNPTNVFDVRLISLNKGFAVLGFTTMMGRTYVVSGSSDLKNWTPLPFTIPAQGAGATAQTSFYSPDIRPLRIQTMQPATNLQAQFFRVELH